MTTADAHALAPPMRVIGADNSMEDSISRTETRRRTAP